MHQIVWTKRVMLFFQEMAQLTDVQKQILEARIAGVTVKEMSISYNMSQRTIANIIHRLKMKYDVVQSEYPDVLKPRKGSLRESFTQ